MPAQYIDETYVRVHMGTAVVSSITDITGVTLTTLIEAATARVQSALRNGGYSTPDETEDEAVKLATLGVLRELLSDIPEASLPLPDNWRDRATNPVRILKEILDGELPLSGHSLSIPDAVGGWAASSHEDTSTGLPPRATRDELKGY